VFATEPQVLTLRNIVRAAKPEYFFRPNQIARRVWIETQPKTSEPTTVWLPWGYPIIVNPTETIGWAIYSRAIYELPMTEALWRLANPGDIVVDGGANLGYATSILAARVGPTGKVHSFEPNPRAFAQLRQNVDVWEKRNGVGASPFVLHTVALGAQPGVATLHVPTSSDWNGGRARIESQPIDEPGSRVDVKIVPLDDIFANGERIAVIKLDLEGFELDALRGMKNLIAERRIDAIVFEELDPFPAPTHTFLKEAGFSIFGLEHGFLGIECLKDRQPFTDPVLGPPTNYVATFEPDKTVQRLQTGLWRSFGPGSYLQTSTASQVRE
jgi:FkbM family methyltransferase